MLSRGGLPFPMDMVSGRVEYHGEGAVFLVNADDIVHVDYVASKNKTSAVERVLLCPSW